MLLSFFSLQEKIIKGFRDYSLLLFDAKCKTKYVKSLKMATPKQMIQRIVAALAQVKAGKISENLLNLIRQIIYSYY